MRQDDAGEGRGVGQIAQGSLEQIEAAARQIAESGRLTELFLKMAELAGFDPDEVREGLSSDFEAKGIVDGVCVVRVLPEEIVRQLLPEGLELAPQVVVPSGHPVVFLFTHNFYEAWFGDREYEEMLFAVPYVQRTDTHVPNRGPFLYMPRLYLNENLLRILGNRLYGWEKLEGVIETTADRYTVRRGSELVIRAGYEEPSHDLEQAAAGNALLDDVRQLLEMPTISQVSRIVHEDAFNQRAVESAFLCSNVRYLFDDPSAVIQPMRAQVLVTEHFTPGGVPVGSFDAPSLSDSRLGAFRMKLPTRVTQPGAAADTGFPKPAPARRKRVAVLGGGPAACAAAFYLAKQPEHYDVSLYTMGWRLGGKCAAGRSPDHESERIEEHGLHAFLGFYDNAIRTVGEAWREAGLEIATDEGPVAGAFQGKLDVGVMDRFDGQWRYFETGQPPNTDVPGAIPQKETDRLPGFGELMGGVLERVRNEIVRARRSPSPTSLLGRAAALWGTIKQNVVVRTASRLIAYLQEVAVEEVADSIARGGMLFRVLAWLLCVVRSGAKWAYAADAKKDADEWFEWSSLDVLLTIVVGILRSRADHFDKLDGQDFREWLLAHGLDPRNADVASIRYVYDTLFANADDAPVRTDKLAAGVAVRWFLLVAFGYRGFPAYDFRFSCPQTMMTPYYKALTKLGAKVHFFHRVEELLVEPSAEGVRLSGVRMQRQATVRDTYDPFPAPRTRVDPEGLPAWPTEPLWDQLVEGEMLRAQGIDLEDVWSGWPGVEDVVLRQGDDFDLCVLGIPVGALPPICDALTAETSPTFLPKWAQMVAGITVCPTYSFQLWFDTPAEQMYSGPRRELATGYVPPWPSFGEFTHLVQWEGWPTSPALLVYHTGAKEAGVRPPEEPELGWARRVTDETRTEIVEWLRENYRGIYDRVETWDDFLGRLSAPSDLEGEARLEHQYFTARVQPSDLYTLSRPGEMGVRLGQAESGVLGLVLCGDWTKTDLNCGCVEAATQSGMLAARVISNEPRYVWHPGF